MTESRTVFPLFSVLMTAYNRQSFIDEAINSVLVQTCDDWELIIVDDKSTDDTVTIARAYEHKDPRVRVYVNESNLGDYANRNRAASYASGEFLMYVDSDDYIYPDALSYIKNCFDNHPKSQFASLYRENEKCNPPKACSLMSATAVIEEHFFRNSILHIGPGGTVIRNSYFKSINGFPEKYGPANDMYYNIMAAIGSPVILMHYNYLFYRDHPGQEVKNRFAYVHFGYTYFNKILDLQELPLSKSQKKYLRVKNKRRFVVNLSRYCLSGFKFKKAVEAIKKSGFGFKDFLIAIFQK